MSNSNSLRILKTSFFSGSVWRIALFYGDVAMMMMMIVVVVKTLWNAYFLVLLIQTMIWRLVIQKLHVIVFSWENPPEGRRADRRVPLIVANKHSTWHSQELLYTKAVIIFLSRSLSHESFRLNCFYEFRIHRQLSLRGVNVGLGIPLVLC